MSLPIKDPEDELDYSIDWSPWLLEGADSISTSSWTATPDGLTIAAESVVGKRTVVWLGGGVSGSTYTIKNRITTSGGRTTTRIFDLIVRTRS